MSTVLVSSSSPATLLREVQPQPENSRMTRLTSPLIRLISSFLAPGQETCRFAASYRSFGKERYWFTHVDLYRFAGLDFKKEISSWRNPTASEEIFERLKEAAVKCQTAFPHARGFHLATKKDWLLFYEWSNLTRIITSLPTTRIDSLFVQIGRDFESETFAERLDEGFLNALNAHLQGNKKITRLILNLPTSRVEHGFLKEPFLASNTVRELRCSIYRDTSSNLEEVGRHFPAVTHLTVRVLGPRIDKPSFIHVAIEIFYLKPLTRLRSLTVYDTCVKTFFTSALEKYLQGQIAEIRLYNCDVRFVDYSERRKLHEKLFAQKLFFHSCRIKDF
ncbi:MAG: hypothetical protein HYX48_04035 [Chlamydiales bacterium]|nr:hypothetical protein [Chlamydiales bacterium]